MRVCPGLILWAAASALAEQAGAPVFFIAHPSTTNQTVRFVGATGDLRVGFEDSGLVFQRDGAVLRMQFRGENPNARVEGAEPLAGRVNFLNGSDSARWRTGLPTYGELVYRGVYPGIDARYSAHGSRMKAEFVVQPSADPGQIQLEYSGGMVALRPDQGLRVSGEAGELNELAPVAFQQTEKGRVNVEVRFVLLDRHTVGFALGAYDLSRALTIDPVISYSTYLGGTDQTAVTGLAVDGAGYLYATGWTAALDFPIAGSVQPVNQGGVEAFVAKFATNGTSLIYATYIGGSGDDRAAAIAVDPSGQAWVTGSTASSNFPQAPVQGVTLGGGRDAFVLKLNGLGNLLLFSRYLGGSNWDIGTAIATDTSGNAYVAGDTLSASFPVSAALQSVIGGKTDAFVVKFNSAGGVVWSTFLGGSGDEHTGGIALDSSGSIYLAGGTASANFPVAGAIQTVLSGAQDAFVAKIAASGASLIYSTYLGGSSGGGAAPEQANAIAVDSLGAAYIGGVTSSTNFPVTTGAFATSFAGVQDGFVSKINAAGSALVYSTYLGGYSNDWITGIGVDGSANAYVAGFSASANFPTANSLQPFGGLYDAFITQLNPAGNSAPFSTFWGGSGSDGANALASDAAGNIFVGGQTASFDLVTANAIQSTNTGGSTGWVTRLGVPASSSPGPSAVSVSPSSGSGGTIVFVAQYSHPSGAASIVTTSLLIGSTASQDFACYVSYNRAANVFTLYNDLFSQGGFTVTPGSPSGKQNSQCALNGIGTSGTLSGNTLTVSYSITFQPGFSGAKSVYLAATDVSNNTGWISRGSWTVTVPAAQPSVGSVTWSNSTFSFVFSDSQNVNNLTGVGMLFSVTPSTTNACYIFFDRNVNTIQLFWDNSSAGSDAKAVTSATPLQNSQCIVGSVTATVSGLSVVVSVNVLFKSPFTGSKFIFGYAAEGYTNTGWVQISPYTVTVGGVPVVNSVVPGSGSGPSQRFTFTVSDQGGASFIKFVGILFNSSLNVNNACYVQFDPNANTLAVAYDIASNGATPVTPGTNAIATSGQCVLKAVNSQVVYTSTAVVVTADLTFTASFSGNKTIYVYAGENAANTGWVSTGSWTATGGSPTADSMNPASGSGNWQTFTFTSSDSASQLNINGMSILFTLGSPANVLSQCFLVYNRDTGSIGLYDDNVTTLSTKGIGYSTLLQNSQCWVGYTLMTTTGNSVNFLIELQFKPTFSGPKSVYLKASEIATNSGWVSRGTWTVP